MRPAGARGDRRPKRSAEPARSRLRGALIPEERNSATLPITTDPRSVEVIRTTTKTIVRFNVAAPHATTVVAH
jgi:hypothetical protein